MSQGQVPPDGAARPNWRTTALPTDSASAMPASSRGKQLVASLAILLALLGAIVIILQFWGGITPPYFLSLAIREYGAPVLPVNSLALQDADLLAKRFEQGKVERPYNTQTGEGLRRALADLGQKTSAPVVVYLCALARCRDDKVFLLGSDADPDQMNNETWVPLSEVLRKMRECPAPGKLLILDLARTESDARFGVFADNSAANVQAALAAEKDLRMYVLCACSAGQTAQVSEELGNSLFAYYLDQGLRGHADGYAGGARDFRVTVTELAEYVKEHVDRCAWKTRGVRQTPVLVSQGDDFPLLRFEEADLASAADKEAPKAYPAWLGAAWEERDKWRAGQSRLGPGVLRALEAVLLRTERRWRGGIDDKRLGEELVPAQKTFRTQVQRIKASSLPPLPGSLALAQPENQKGVASFPGVVDNLLSRASEFGLKSDDKDRAKQAEELDKEVKAAQAVLSGQPEAAVLVLFEDAAAWSKLGRAHVALLDRLLRALPLKTRYPETVLLERVAEHAANTRDRDWPVATAQQALRTTRACERALAALAQEPALLPWVKDLFQEADDKRRDGEKKLFYGRPKDWAKAADNLTDAEAIYAKAQTRAEALRGARRTRDQALALLPALAPMLLALPKEHSAEANIWHEAAQSAGKLVDALAAPGDLPGELPEGVIVLGEQLAHLQRFFEKRAASCLHLGEFAKGEDDREVQALLESPYWAGPRRQDLWKAGQKLALRLLGETLALDSAEKTAKSSATVAGGPDHGAQRIGLQKRLRFQQAIDMIHLAGSYPLEKELQAAYDKADRQAWGPLVEKLSAAWPRQFLAELKSGSADMVKADRLERLLSPFDLNAVGVKSTDENHWSRNPALALYRRDLAAFWRWLGDRFQADGEAVDEGSRFRADFRDWAEQYRTRAITMP